MNSKSSTAIQYVLIHAHVGRHTHIRRDKTHCSETLNPLGGPPFAKCIRTWIWSQVSQNNIHICMQPHCRRQNTLFYVPKSTGTSSAAKCMLTRILSLIQQRNIHTQTSTRHTNTHQKRQSIVSCPYINWDAISMRNSFSLETPPDTASSVAHDPDILSYPHYSG
jgi:hypothetical protein